jgi:hypothetical protein
VDRASLHSLRSATNDAGPQNSGIEPLSKVAFCRELSRRKTFKKVEACPGERRQ